MPDPLWINASGGAPSYDAAELRRLHAVALTYDGRTLGARAGVRPGGNALETSVAGSTITVRAGLACVDPALTTAQGPYWVALPADETHTLTAAHATLARKDITVLRVYDNDEDASGLRLARSEYIAGDPGSGVPPAVPAGAFRLATIDVPASGGGSPVVTVDCPYTVAAGGVLPVRSAAERDALVTPYDGMGVYRRDRDWREIHDGAAWRVQGVPVVVSAADLSAITSPFNGQLVYNSGLGIYYKRVAGVWHLAQAVEYPQPTQTGSGSLAANTTATVSTVSVPDLGVPYRVVVTGQLVTTTPVAGSPAAVQATYSSSTWDTNRIGSSGNGRGYIVGLDAVCPLPARRSDQLTGAHDIRFLTRANANAITVGTVDYNFRVYAVPSV